MTLEKDVESAHAAGKKIFLHMDLAEGIGKDKAGLQYVKMKGVDGIISTKGHIIRTAREHGLLTVQRFFALDSQGISTIRDTLKLNPPHYIEIMPGVIPKLIKRFSDLSIPIIAGGLIETKAEVTGALRCGAIAVSTGRQELWSV